MKKLTLTIPLQDLKDILWAIDDCLIRKCEKQEKLKIIGDNIQATIKQAEQSELKLIPISEPKTKI